MTAPLPKTKPLTLAGRTLLRLLPERLGIALSYWEACRPPKAKVSPVEAEAMATATPLRFGPGGRNEAWSWGEGPLVVLVHGWGGRAAQMAPLARHVASLGYQAVAPDITGHGNARGRHTTWPFFFRDLAQLQQALGREVHAYVGHSIGGLAIMGARHVNGLRATRYVCVCTASYPARGAQILDRRVAPSPAGLAHYKAFIASQFQAPSWEAMAAGWVFRGCGPETLLVYDLNDRFMSHEEGDRVVAAHPDVVLKKIDGRGHNRILLDRQLMDLVGDFLAP